MFDNKVYDVLKWLCLIALPAISVFINVMGQIWGFPYSEQIMLTISAVATLLGALIGVSTRNYNKEE